MCEGKKRSFCSQIHSPCVFSFLCVATKASSLNCCCVYLWSCLFIIRPQYCEDAMSAFQVSTAQSLSCHPNHSTRWIQLILCFVFVWSHIFLPLVSIHLSVIPETHNMFFLICFYRSSPLFLCDFYIHHKESKQIYPTWKCDGINFSLQNNWGSMSIQSTNMYRTSQKLNNSFWSYSNNIPNNWPSNQQTIDKTNPSALQWFTVEKEWRLMGGKGETFQKLEAIGVHAFIVCSLNYREWPGKCQSRENC